MSPNKNEKSPSSPSLVWVRCSLRSIDAALWRKSLQWASHQFACRSQFIAATRSDHGEIVSNGPASGVIIGMSPSPSKTEIEWLELVQKMQPQAWRVVWYPRCTSQAMFSLMEMGAQVVISHSAHILPICIRLSEVAERFELEQNELLHGLSAVRNSPFI